jgi:diguanylate cyclase (GGDEF)-like protein
MDQVAHGMPAAIAGWDSDLAIALRELARTERELAALELRYRSVMEGIDEGVILLDERGRITTVNTAALRLFSTEGAIREWIWGDGAGPSGTASIAAGTRVHPVMETLIDARPRRGIEMPARTAEGIERWLAVSVRALIDADTMNVAGAVCSFADITARRSQRDELERQATVDVLTGAFNRRYLEHRLVAEVSRARRARLPLSLAVADLDHFKDINDRHGHAAGDKALRTFVSIVAGSLRTEDVVARLGGDEFCMLFPGTGARAAAVALERCVKVLRATEIEGEGGRFRVSGTFGIAELQPSIPPEALLARADEALYRAKAAGRGRVLAADH